MNDWIFWCFWTLSAISNSLTDWYGFEHVNNGWKNKYAQPFVDAPNTLYYRLTGLRYKERFPLSGTALIFITDLFHWYQFNQVVLIIASILTFRGVDLLSLWPFILIPVVWGFVTHFSYIVISKLHK